LLHRIKEFFFPPSVSTAAELRSFVTGEASYLAQKTVVGYCRVKTMLDYEKLLTEAPFREGQDICRWEAYASTLGDIVIMTEAWLRPDDADSRRRVADALAALYASILTETVPTHRQSFRRALCRGPQQRSSAARENRHRLGRPDPSDRADCRPSEAQRPRGDPWRSAAAYAGGAYIHAETLPPR
jgi:hypothetical protein